MANSRTMYMAKKDTMGAETSHITFTPPQQVHHWQVRLTAEDNALPDVLIETLDMESDATAVARLNAAADWDLNAASKYSTEVIVDSTAKSLKVYNKKAGKTMDVKVIAYRSTDDVMGGSFSEKEGVTYAAS